MLVNDSEAVLSAMKEFDALGRDAFLAKYNFGKAREFFLFHNGKFYDSKAIVGVAHGFEAKDSTALNASAFSGGEDTVKKTLTGLGFTVVRTRLPDVLPAGEPKAVLLTWNPQRWKWTERDAIAASVEAGDVAKRRWSCGNTKTLPVGTRAFVLRQGEEPRGIVASGWTVTAPFEAPHWDSGLAAAGDTAYFIEVAFDSVSREGVVPVDPRNAPGPLSDVNWAIPASGTSLSGKPYEALESLWASREERPIDGAPWTRPELTASVVSYLEMRRQSQSGQSFVKAEYYRDLAKRFGRTEKAYGYRMQNISFVFSLLGREWVPGLKPARNVGAAVAAELESILAEIEDRPATPDVAFEAQVSAEVQKGKASKNKPSGSKQPTKHTGSTTVWDRDPEVKAFVLLEADGVCECCAQKAPFLAADGSPFLEVHHVRRLADGGPDIVENAVAICPNCHRELHYGVDAPALVNRLYQRIGRLAR